MAGYIREKKFLYGGRILSNRGLYKEGRKVTYSNCYVISPPEDNIESIFDCAKKLARTYSYGGAAALTFPDLLPKVPGSTMRPKRLPALCLLWNCILWLQA